MKSFEINVYEYMTDATANFIFFSWASESWDCYTMSGTVLEVIFFNVNLCRREGMKGSNYSVTHISFQ
jgi:hypothetical protein